MIFIMGLSAVALVLAASIGLASVVVKAYACAPPILLTTLRHLFDFLFAFTEAFCKLAAIILLFLYNFVIQFFGSFLLVIPTVLRVANTLLSFLLWVCVILIRGLLGLEAKAMNTLSWLIAISVLFLYVEKKYQNIGVTLFVNGRPNFARVLIRNAHRHNNNTAGNNNTGRNVDAPNEETGVAPERLEENQLLEIENRENENEENALEEADRNRVNIDNVQNDQRELDRDRAEQAQPVNRDRAVFAQPVNRDRTEFAQPVNRDRTEFAQPVNRDRAEQAQPVNRDRAEFAQPVHRNLLDDDSSDEDIDPTMCSVCLHRVRGAALFPCGHTQLCRICARIIIAAQRPCPMCQTPIQEFRNVYV